jgi:hypothetical protein|nr:MAG TPA: crossover junction endodeoxyribonuclease [Bacteriophage sp.]
MTYKVVIKGVDSIFPLKGLNELLESRLYNPRTKKYHNPVKTFNDRVCLKAIKRCLPSVHIDKPIRCTYHIYTADKRHDRSNLYSAIEKSFLDALQLAKVIKNDGWDDVYDSVFHTEVDKENSIVVVEIEVLERGNN